jgi:hypothetical protein
VNIAMMPEAVMARATCAQAVLLPLPWLPHTPTIKGLAE